MTRKRRASGLQRAILQGWLLPVLALMVAQPQGALAARPHRLTDHGGTPCSIAAPAVNGTASLTAFESTCDLTGENADGNREIFQVSRSGAVSQLTVTVACTNANPSSSFSGGVVAFDSNCNLGDNSDANVEIFTVAAGVVTQVTSSANCYNFAPSINSNATLVSFDSDCDLTGSNMDRSVEIFRATIAGGIQQITDDRSSSGCASINAAADASGDVIAFESDCDLTGGNEAQVNEIFESRPASGITRLTDSQGDACVNATPAISSDGGALAFASDCDLLGENPDGGTEIYTMQDETLVQLTQDAGATGCESLSPAIGTREGADRVVYAGYCDPTGDNADGSFEIFGVIDGVTEQLTDGESCWSVSPQIPSSGDVVVYVSSCDFDGSGEIGSPELYLEGLCVCGGPVSAGQPTATDALYALQTGVGVQECALCECDVNGDGRVAATDALLILAKATGQQVSLSCP